MIITVDGLSGSGKGTLSKALSNQFNIPMLETGLLWRKTACLMLTDGDELTDENTSNAIFEQEGVEFSEKELRSNITSQTASIISGFANARHQMDCWIINWVNRQAIGCVLDGREGGISHAPHADHKFFLFAATEIRATRRMDQLGFSSDKYWEVYNSIRDRDVREINRSVAPSKPAHDAILIDTSAMTAWEVQEFAVRQIGTKFRFNNLVSDTRT